MKKALPWIFFFVGAVWIAASSRHDTPKPGTPDFQTFGEIPVLLNGRIKPLDTVARNSLMVIRDKQSARSDDGEKIPAIEWLAEVLFAGPTADERPVFLIHDPEILSLFGWRQDQGKYYSFAELFPFFEEIDQQARKAGELEAQEQSRFQKHVLRLYQQLTLYQRLKNTIQLEDTPDWENELRAFQMAIQPGLEAINRREQQLEFDEDAFNRIIVFGNRYQQFTKDGYFFTAPFADPETGEAIWRKTGEVVLETIHTGTISPILSDYASLSSAFRAGDSEGFDAGTRQLLDRLKTIQPKSTTRASQESFFNHLDPFYRSMVLYVLVFLLACLSWLNVPALIGRTAYTLGLLALILHTAGLIYRMVLEGRPPVTNLYSSAVFMGWGAAVLGLVLERLYRNGLGSVTAAGVGFASLLIAHHLSGDGDTMEMMRAVLDSNFWLATHVVVITIGYSATYLAGVLAIVYIIRGVLTRTLNRETARSLNGMVYGIVCFATLFSFVGTVLGGIWADQSWGRFWGWDPKENGAVLIVIWNAIILHARWGGYIRQRGLMNMAVFGNIVTSWSWFGTNMLGVGLHTYGFMDKAFVWLVIFILSQLAVIGLGSLPSGWWRSRIDAPKASEAGL